MAAFDVDGTITVRDCVVPFLRNVGGWAGIARSLAGRPAATLRGGWQRDRDWIKEIVVGGVLGGRLVDEVTALGSQFANRVVDSWLRADVVRRLRWHQRHDHRVVLVSASLDCYLNDVGRHLGVDGVVCTRPAHAGGQYTGTLDGPNCRAEEKVRRLDAWLGEQELGGAEVWAYGDSAGDRALLERADVGEWVKGRTLAEAPSR